MNLDEMALKINQSLKEDSLIKEYLTLKQKITELGLDKEQAALVVMQKQLTNAFMNDSGDYQQLKADYLGRKQAYDNHPVVINYQNVAEEVEAFLVQVKKLIEDEL